MKVAVIAAFSVALAAGVVPLEAQVQDSTQAAVRRPTPARPPLTGGIITGQILSAGAGGLLGAVIGAAPFLIGSLGGEPVAREDVILGTIVVGYFAGAGIGLHEFSRTVGLKSSWRATLTGAVLGLLGGPAAVVTVPMGATAGFNARRESTMPTPPPRLGNIPQR